MSVRFPYWAAVILLTFLNTFPNYQNVSAAPLACASPCAWGGIYPTVLTPFCADGVIDTASLERQISFELQGGVQGLLLLGTIGEGQYVSMEERAQVIATAVHAASSRVPVVVGIHTCDLACAQAQSLQARQLGAQAVLVKYVGNPSASPGEVLGFFAALSDMHLLPIFYYHYPSQTSLRLEPSDIGAILCLPGVVGIKESTLNLRETQAHFQCVAGKGKVFLSGTALNLTQFMDVGGQGAMCPEAVLLPGPTTQAYHAYLRGQKGEARALQEELFEMTPILRSKPTSPGITRRVVMSAQDHKLPLPLGKDEPQARLKEALNCMGVPTPILVKCPLPQLTEVEKQKVAKVVHGLKAIDWMEVTMKVPPVPPQSSPTEGGGLLKTGSFILGPGVGRDFLRSVGDGKSGLE